MTVRIVAPPPPPTGLGRSPFNRSVVASLLLLAILLCSAIAQAQTANSSAFGVQFGASSIGGLITGNAGPAPVSSGSGAGVYADSDSLDELTASLKVLGIELASMSAGSGAGNIETSAFSNPALTPGAEATVENTNLGLGLVLSRLLTLSAATVHVTAGISPCGTALEVTGSTTISGGATGGTLGAGLSLSSTPAPNTVLLDTQVGPLNTQRLRVVLNEQLVSVEPQSRSIMVNGIHVTLTSAVIGTSVVSGDVIVGQARAELSCDGFHPPANLGIQMVDSPSPVVSPGTLSYLITATNNGTASVSAARVVDTLPLSGSVTFGSATPSQGSCGAPAGSVLTCDLGLLNPGASATIAVSLNVLAGATGPLVNTAGVVDASGTTIDPDGTNDSAQTSTPVTDGGGGGGSSADLSIGGNATPNPVAPNGVITFTVTATNQGPDTANNVVIVNPVPAGATLISAVPSAGGACDASVSCAWASIAAGGSATLTLTLGAPNVVGPLVNSASVSSEATDGNLTNNSVSTTAQVTGGDTPPVGADLSVSVVVTPNPVHPGDLMTYTVTVTNHGPGAATNVIVTNPVPAGVTFLSATATNGGTCGLPHVTCSIPSIASNTSATVVIQVIAPASPGQVVNTTTVGSSAPDDNPGDNAVTTTTTIESSGGGGGDTNADLEITVVVSPNPVQPGGTLTYTVTITNHGPATAPNVTVTNLVPAGVTLVSVNAGGGGVCGQPSVTCTFASIGANTSVTIVITMLAPSVPGVVINTTTVGSGAPDGNPSDNSVTTSTQVGLSCGGVTASLMRAITSSFGVPSVTGTVPLLASVLPGSRSVQSGCPATALVSIINVGVETALGVSIAPAVNLPMAFTYQALGPTNAPIGTANTPVNIAAGAVQSFVIALTPAAAFAPTDVPFAFGGTNTIPVTTLVGVNTLLLSSSSTPVPDVVAMAATLANDGIVNVPGPSGTGVFSVASVNVGLGGAITVSADTGAGTPPVTIQLCRTNGLGQCLAAPATSVALQVNPGDTPSFGVFVTAHGDVPFDPAQSRVFVRFKETNTGTVRGATSVAVRTQ